MRDVSFTVSWLTDLDAPGEVHYGTDPNNLNQTASDLRGAMTSEQTHYVRVENILPNTTYYFDVVSGNTTDNNNGSHYSLTTGDTLGVPSSDTIYGPVLQADGSTPAIGSLVYITLEDNNGTGSPAQAAPLSALVTDQNGLWYTNLGNVRSADLSSYFNYSAAGDKLHLEAQRAPDQVGCITVDTADDTPAADIVLGGSCTTTWEISLQLGLEPHQLAPFTRYLIYSRRGM